VAGYFVRVGGGGGGCAALRRHFDIGGGTHVGGNFEVRSVQCNLHCRYRDADKSLARPGGKQATATKEFDFHISYL
jgi:hypothetical protein